MGFTHTIQSPLSYEGAFGEEDVVHFVHVRIVDIEENMMSSNVLAANSRATYIRFSKASRKMIRNQEVLSRLIKLDKEAPTAKILDITQLNYRSLYISSKEDILFMVQVSDAVVKNERKPASLHAKVFLQGHPSPHR